MSVVDYQTIITVPGSVPDQLRADWLTGASQAAVTKTKARWDAIVGTSELWTTNVAQTSNANWKDFPNPNYVSRRGRDADMQSAIQLAKLGASFDKAKAAHDLAFANAGEDYIAAVTAGAPRWQTAMRQVIAITGDRLFGRRGPASIIVRLAAGDKTYLRDTAGGTAPTGEVDPERAAVGQVGYLNKRTRQYFKAAFEGFLNQTIYNLLMGYLTETTQADANSDNILKGFISAGGALPPTSFIHFSTTGGVTVTLHLDNNDVTP